MAEKMDECVEMNDIVVLWKSERMGRGDRNRSIPHRIVVIVVLPIKNCPRPAGRPQGGDN